MKLCEAPNTDTTRIFKHFGVDPGRLAAGSHPSPRPVQDRATRAPRALAADHALAQRGVDAGVDRAAGPRRCAPGICSWRCSPSDDLARLAAESSPELAKISVEDLTKRFGELTAGSAEDATSRPAWWTGRRPGRPAGKTPALDQYTIDLTARARQGEIDPVLGRDFEIRQLVDILTRRRQNNPILTGEAGVGKTAVVEGFALRIAAGDVPPPLRNVALRTLDLGLLQAGAGVKGEFENRLK